jgi:hypothetical protein
MRQPRVERRIVVQPVGDGFAVVGPQFYVWDRDRDHVVRIARELAAGHLGVVGQDRTLIVRRRAARAGRGNPEALD